MNAAVKPKNQIGAYRMIDAVLRSCLRTLPPWQWAEHTALWWGYRFRPAPTRVRLRSGASIGFSAPDYLQLLIYYQGVFEPHCLPYLKLCAEHGDTVVDVGANIGFYTLESALAVGSAGRVISIEAAPPIFEALAKNVAANEFRQVRLVKTAVSDVAGEAVLALPRGDNLGMFTLGTVESTESYHVSLRPLDDVLEETGLDSLALIKIDIEGSEYRALRGAARTIGRYKPAILIELNESALFRCGSSAAEVRRHLEDAGYAGWVIGRQGLRSLPAAAAAHHCDECLFVHSDDQRRLEKLHASGAIHD